MSNRDRDLGMNRKISRRDFIHGVAGTAAGAAFLGAGCEQEILHSGPTAPGRVGYGRGQAPPAASYPPIRSGLRGSHEGAYQVAHALAREGKTDWGPTTDPDATTYDLVVVGGGLSGLSAAYFYRKENPDARILILENHDDFGGHAKRNEFQVGDRTILGHGGTQTFETPGDYSDVAKGLLADLAVDLQAFNDEYYDHDFYRRHGLTSTVFFDEETFGTNRTVPMPGVGASYFLPVAPAHISMEQAVAQMPISDEARREFLRLHTSSEDKLKEHGLFSEPAYLETISYRDLLTRHFGITNEEVLLIYRDMAVGYYGVGIEALPAIWGLGFGLPGLKMTSLGNYEGLIRKGIGLLTEPYTAHYPDGGASLARLLVRRLIPGVAPGTDDVDIVTAPFDYSRLDSAASPTRIRLSSTAVNVEHEGSVSTASEVAITYVRGGITERVRAKNCILACYGVIIPHLCPTLPQKQREALATQSKVPLVYTSALLRNWQALKKQRIALAHCPGSWHQSVITDFPVSLGDYKFANDPDQPIVLNMIRVPTSPGLPPREQHRAGRYALLGTPFEMIERTTRSHLAGMLGAGGFDPAQDILGITVNRHPHGYAYEYNSLFDPDYSEGESPHEIGRRPFGRIRVANSDSGGRAYMDCAIDEAWRAVGELNG